MNRKLMGICGLLLMACFALACEGGGGSSGGTWKDPFDALRNNPDVNKNAWYTSMAVLCSEGEPRPGCNFKYDGKKVTFQEDPYKEKLNGFTLTRDTYTDSDYVQKTREVWHHCAIVDHTGCVPGYITETYYETEYFDNYLFTVHTPDGQNYNWVQWTTKSALYADQLGGWKFDHYWEGSRNNIHAMMRISPNGIRYSYEGYALNAAKIMGGTNGNDVVGSVAEVRADQIKGISEVLQAKFALDTDVSEQAAASLVDWSEIGSKRARTRDDMEAFSKRVYGIELGRIEDVALLARDGKAELAIKEMDSLVGEAAQNWRTSPETMREVLNFFYGNLMN